MIKYTILFVLLFIMTFPTCVSAHTGTGQTVGEYRVTKIQEPLSPFVGENVRVNFIINDNNNKPVQGLKGELVLKETVENQYVGKDSEKAEKILLRKPVTTDEEGNVLFEKTFNKESVFDVEFVWGNDKQTESSGLQIFVRDPTSFFAPQELQKRIWLFVIIALAGLGAGAFFTFIILTTTLHPKK